MRRTEIQSMLLSAALATCGGCSKGKIADPANSSGEDIHCSTQAVVDGPVDFAPARDIGGTFVDATAVDAGDINADGFADVVMLKSARFSWYAAPASPTGEWVSHTLPQPPTRRSFLGAAKLGDVDGDGDLDLIVSMDKHSTDPRSAYIYLYENPGPETAADGSAWLVRQIVGNLGVHHINDMALADMDGDGRLDVVVRSLDPNRLYIFFQDAKTSWFERAIDSAPYGAEGEGFAVGNIDRAGLPDITICGYWLRAPGDPRTEAYEAYAIDAGYHAINANVKEAIGDINGDGRNDVILSPAEGYRNGGNHVLAWYEAPANPATGSWIQHVIVDDTNGGHTVVLADLDNDTDLDVVHGIAWADWGQTRSIRAYFNQGAGVYDGGQTISATNGLYTGVVVDVGADGDLDIVGQRTFGGLSATYLYESRESGAAPGTCTDGVQNGGETGVDCGGPCPPCPEPGCGDGRVDPGEECDDGNTNDVDSCSNMCVLATCMDGQQNQGEIGIDCGGPCPTCPVVPSCGNGTVEPPEQCDDGNTNDSDGCTNACLSSTCSDGLRNQGEAAPDCGGPCPACPSPPECGNGIVEGGEACDDGNRSPLDFCTNSCTSATCSDGSRNQGEVEVDCGGPCEPCGRDGEVPSCRD